MMNENKNLCMMSVHSTDIRFLVLNFKHFFNSLFNVLYYTKETRLMVSFTNCYSLFSYLLLSI